jgi:hypothetical protein
MLQENKETTRTFCLKLIKKKPKYTDQDIENFRNDPKHNPKTGRPISGNGNIYKQLKKELDMKDKVNTFQNIPPRVIVKKLRPKGLATNEEK